jgi:hypothetical protein
MFIGKEPIATIPNTSLELLGGTILSLIIGVSRQHHFYIITYSIADGKPEVTYTLLCSNLLQHMVRVSKSKDLLEHLDQVARW